MLSTVPVVVDRTILLFMNVVTAGKSMLSVTGLKDIGTTVTGVITFASASEDEGALLHDMEVITIQISKQKK
jgi:hypothetical protein